MQTNVIMAGFGGQGILFIGNLLAESALLEGYNVTYLPSYGVEMRGGTANCTVVISDQEIGSPQVSFAEVVLAMSEQAREKYQSRVKSEGLLLVNSSLAEVNKIARNNQIEVLALPFNQIATEMGEVKFASMIALGCYLAQKPVVKLESIEQILKEQLAGKKAQFLSLNLKAIEKGLELGKNWGGKND